MSGRCLECKDREPGCQDRCVYRVANWLAETEEKKVAKKAKDREMLIHDLVKESKARRNRSKTLGKLSKHKGRNSHPEG